MEELTEECYECKKNFTHEVGEDHNCVSCSKPACENCEIQSEDPKMWAIYCISCHAEGCHLCLVEE